MSATGIAYDLPSSYEALITRLEELADKASCGVVKQPALPLRQCFKREDGEIIFDYIMQLRNWTARKEKFHIFIHAQETIIGAKGSYLLKKSTVRVSYYGVKENITTPQHTVHYDYGPEQKGHPIFHAQFCGDHIDFPTEDLAELGHQLAQVESLRIFKNARIPTSDMTLPSVLLCVAADHVAHDFFPEFRNDVAELQKKLPKPAFEKTRTSMQAQSDHFRSSHWFAHHIS